jgi:UDP-glucose:(heptosyl)LPS alpha-1,3-glucosyltransferase
VDLAFIAKTLSGTGGTESDLNQLIRGLLDRGHRVTVYAARIRGEGPPGCRQVSVPVLGIGPLAELWSLAWLGPRLAYRGGHDLVIGYARLVRQDIVRCGGGSHAAYLETLNAASPRMAGAVRRIQPKHQSILAIERLQYKPGRYRRVLAISEGVKADLMRLHGVPEGDISVVPDGVNTVRFHPGLRDLHRAAVRSSFGIQPEARCILFVGNGFRRKGLECLLRAGALSRISDLHILVVGSDPDQARYRQLASQLGIGPQVTFAGRQADPERFYGAADMLALPAIQEAFGNVVLEAMASGLPAVVSRAAGSAEILNGDLAAGLLDNPLDPRECADRIREIMTKAASGSLGPVVRRKAEDYSIERHIARTESVFQDVLDAVKRR